MAFTLPPLSLAMPSNADSGGSAAMPVNLNIPWISVHQIQSHSNGSTLSSSASSNPTTGSADAGGMMGGSIGGIPIIWIALGAGAWLLLR